MVSYFESQCPSVQTRKEGQSDAEWIVDVTTRVRQALAYLLRNVHAQFCMRRQHTTSPPCHHSSALPQASLEGRAEEFVAAFAQSEAGLYEKKEIEQQLHAATMRREWLQGCGLKLS